MRLRITSPPIHGPIVSVLQRHVNHHLAAWGAAPHAQLKVDGVYGILTRRRTLEVCYGLGISRNDTAHGIGIHTQHKIADTKHLTGAERQRREARHAWRRRLVARLGGGPVGQATAFARAMTRKGIVEHPPGSNSGPYITNWQHLAGYPSGVPWCGCFINACLVAGGMPSQHWGIGYVPYIEAHAHSGIDGWRWEHPQVRPQAGWIATFGRDLGEHTEFVVEDGYPLRTVGGNTSKGDGSFNEGGGVYAHNFLHYQGFPLRGFAVPNYK